MGLPHVRATRHRVAAGYNGVASEALEWRSETFRGPAVGKASLHARPASLATLVEHVEQRVAALQFPLETTVNSLYDDGLTAMTACTFHIYLD